MKTTFSLGVVIAAGAVLGCTRPPAVTPTSRASQNELPPDTTASKERREYRVDPLIEKAVKLRAMGKDEAVKVLGTMADDRGWDDNSVIYLCRMLFTAKPGRLFRPPMLGGPLYFCGTEADDWPLDPIEIVDGVPFLIVGPYVVGGVPEWSAHYLEYCVNKCDWGTTEFKPRTAEEKQKALEKLLASPKWTTPPGDDLRKFFAAQIR
ncbi:MAG: hypothetical protein ABGY75_02960 [Gemmataceae bacterium]